MKRLFIVPAIVCMGIVMTACKAKQTDEPKTMTVNQERKIQHMQISIGNRHFSVALKDNETVRALMDKLPMTVNMSELNGNEKYVYLPVSLPAKPESIGTIKAGDVMLYGDNCLVVFYQGFETTYRYTRIGHIKDASGLDAALGDGGVQVVFGR